MKEAQSPAKGFEPTIPLPLKAGEQAQRPSHTRAPPPDNTTQYIARLGDATIENSSHVKKTKQ